MVQSYDLCFLLFAFNPARPRERERERCVYVCVCVSMTDAYQILKHVLGHMKVSKPKWMDYINIVDVDQKKKW